MSEFNRVSHINLEGIRQIGPNRIKEKLNTGRTSSVLLAYNEEYGEDIAVKVITDPDYPADSFQHEVAMHQQLDGSIPNIVPFYGHDISHLNNDSEEVEVSYMELGKANGGSVADHGHLCIEAGIQIVQKAATSLDAMHRLGIVHGDVKPGNWLLTEGPADDIPLREQVLWTADFGATRPSTPPDKIHTGAIGTKTYAAPEAMAGRVEPASDLYSVAASLAVVSFGKRVIPLHPTITYTDTVLSPNFVAYLDHRIRQVIPRPYQDPFRAAMDPNPDMRFDSVSLFADAMANRAQDVRITRGMV